MKKLQLFVLLINVLAFTAIDSYGQAGLFQTAVGGPESDWGSKVIAVEGGYIAIGNTMGFAGFAQDIYVVKTDFGGNLLWTKTYGRWQDDYAIDAISTTDKGFAIAGYTTDSTGQDAYILKADSSGNILWTKNYHQSDAEYGLSLIQTTDGGFMMAGSIRNTGMWDYDAWLVKTDDMGSISWTKTFGNIDDDGAAVVIQTPGDGYIVGGWLYNPADSSQGIYILKMDNIGGVQWLKEYKTPSGLLTGPGILPTADHGYLLSGGLFYSGVNDAYMLKLDSAGNNEWAQTCYLGGNALPYEAINANDGGYIVGGDLDEPGTRHCFLMKAAKDGTILWTKKIGGSYRATCASVIPAKDNGYIICGYVDTNSSLSGDVLLAKVDDAGEGSCNTDTIHAVTSPLTVFTVIPVVAGGSGGSALTAPFSTDYGGVAWSICNATTGVHELPVSNDVRIYPNPSYGKFTVSSPWSSFSIKIMNGMGAAVYEAEVRGSKAEIDLGSVAKGIYFYVIKRGQKDVYRGKLIVQ